jgi:hypothetical protein
MLELVLLCLPFLVVQTISYMAVPIPSAIGFSIQLRQFLHPPPLAKGAGVFVKGRKINGLLYYACDLLCKGVEVACHSGFDYWGEDVV